MKRSEKQTVVARELVTLASQLDESTPSTPLAFDSDGNPQNAFGVAVHRAGLSSRKTRGLNNVTTLHVVLSLNENDTVPQEVAEALTSEQNADNLKNLATLLIDTQIGRKVGRPAKAQVAA